MNIVVAHHGHCFDGMASAALLVRFLRERHPGASVTTVGLDHQAGGSHVPDGVLSGEVNGVVDFRYSVSERLTWFFDHHRTGIVGAEERAHFAADTSGTKFFDPEYGSCARLVADVLRDRFGYSFDDLEPLVRWADVIDTASFTSAAEAVELSDPALELMAVLDAHGDSDFVAPFIDALSRGASIGDLAADRKVKKRFAGIRRMHDRTREHIASTARVEDGVVRFEVDDAARSRFNKFVPYLLFPESRYVVAVIGGSRRVQISVGSNPWAPVPRSHDISELCARHGGGGHPVVGAVSLPANELERARQIADEITQVLND